MIMRHLANSVLRLGGNSYGGDPVENTIVRTVYLVSHFSYSGIGSCISAPPHVLVYLYLLTLGAILRTP